MLRHKKVLSYKYDATDVRSEIKDYTQSMHQHQSDVSHAAIIDEEFEAWHINFINQASADILIYSH